MTNFQLPELGEGIYEAELVQWLVAAGDVVAPGQSLAEVMTDKATMELPSPFAGRITKLRFESGDEMKVGDDLLSYESPGDESEGDAEQTRQPGRQTKGENGKRSQHAVKAIGRSGQTSAATGHQVVAIQAAPSVRRMARQLGVDLSRVQGSGPHGRILLDDLSAHLKAGRTQETAPARTDKPWPVEFHAGSRVKLRGVRRKVAERMVLSRQTIPHFSYVDECDVTDLVRLRESLNDVSAETGVKLTYLPFVVKAVVRSLREVPLINASLDDAAEEIVLHDRYHIGVATATPGGLMVPVVHDADRLNVLQIAREIQRLADEARTGKLSPDDLQGATFTITSIGNFGGLISTPIIQHPQVGIAGIGKIVKRPVFDQRDNVRPAQMMYLSFSFDHRVVDGAVGAVFGNAVIGRLQSPAALLVGESHS